MNVCGKIKCDIVLNSRKKRKTDRQCVCVCVRERHSGRDRHKEREGEGSERVREIRSGSFIVFLLIRKSCQLDASSGALQKILIYTYTQIHAYINKFAHAYLLILYVCSVIFKAQNPYNGQTKMKQKQVSNLMI